MNKKQKDILEGLKTAMEAELTGHHRWMARLDIALRDGTDVSEALRALRERPPQGMGALLAAGGDDLETAVRLARGDEY